MQSRILLHVTLHPAIRLKSYRTVLFPAWLGAEGTSMVLAPFLVLFSCVQHVVNAEELQLPQQVFERAAPPAFLSLSDGGVDSCTTDNVCQEICETDFMVYPLGDKCYEYCHDDIHYIWDVFDKYCGEGLNDEHHFCADLCYDGFYCGDSTCGPCEDKCVEAFGLVHQIFDYCADCDDIGDDYDDDYYKTTTTTTFDKCSSYGADRCYDMECWCHDICDIIDCPHCEELCYKNEDRVWPIFERYCECGFCNEADGEHAGLLQFRFHSAASSESTCGCRSEHQYCIDICHGLGYGGEGLARCTEDCYSSGKLEGILEDYCHECHDDDYETTTKSETTTTTTTTTTPEPYETTTKPYETTRPPYETTRPPYETTRPPYETTRPPYETTRPPYETTRPPYETTRPPYETTRPPYETTRPPYETTRPPYETTRPPYETTRPPYETTRPPYETTRPPYETTRPPYETTRPPYETTRPYYPPAPEPYPVPGPYPAPDYYPAPDVPYYWKIKAAKAKINYNNQKYKAIAKAESFKARHADYFGKYPKKDVPWEWKVKAAKAKAYYEGKKYQAEAAAAAFKWKHPEIFGKHYR